MLVSRARSYKIRFPMIVTFLCLAVAVSAQGPPTLEAVMDAGDGIARLNWSNSADPPAQYLGFAWDIYTDRWVASGWNNTLWYPFPATATSGSINLDRSGGYHIWIANQYPGGGFYPCTAPWTGIVYSGKPHAPLNVKASVLYRNDILLEWKPDIFGTWLFWVIAVDPKNGEGVATQGPLGESRWHYVANGSDDFAKGEMNLTFPSHGSYLLYIVGMGWDGKTMGDFENVNIIVVPTPESSSMLIAQDKANGDFFGESVSLFGDTALVGAFGSKANGTKSGSAYVFTHNDLGWTQEAKLTARDAAAWDGFGRSVSLYEDTALIGTFWNKDNQEAGSAYVFTRSGSEWTQQAKLAPNDLSAFDRFGTVVSLFGDTALIGAYQDDEGGSDSGSVYVFTRSGTMWTKQAKLIADDATAEIKFGHSISLFGDTALIGTDNYGLDQPSSAYVFTRSGNTWTQQAKLTPEDTASWEAFGCAVSLYNDTAIVGDYIRGGSNSGVVYVFTRSGNTWTQQAKLTPNNMADWRLFGCSVSLSGDTVLIGAYGDDEVASNSGAAYIFSRSGNVWTQRMRLKAIRPGSSDNFGWSVSLFGDTALVGANQDDVGGITWTGSTHVFELGRE